MDWLRLAADSGFSAIVAQREELAGMRNRSVAFSGLIVTASAFLVSTAMGNENTDRNFIFFISCALGTASFGVLVYFLIMVIYPANIFQFNIRAEDLAGWLYGETRAPSREVAMKFLIKYIQEAHDYNEKNLHGIRRYYCGMLVMSMTTIGIWAAVAWVFA